MEKDENVGQGHTDQQYEDSARIFCYSLLAILVCAAIYYSHIFELINNLL